MNTRGLMELIVLNIGLELGILKPEIFTIMVVAALVTTFMTTPALSFIERLFGKEGAPANAPAEELTEIGERGF